MMKKTELGLRHINISDILKCHYSYDLGSNQRIHDLKLDVKFHEAIALEIKTFEVRFNDRDFKVGDLLCLRVYDPEKKEYTGWELFREIRYILEGENWGIQNGYVVLGLKNIDNTVYPTQV